MHNKTQNLEPQSRKSQSWNFTYFGGTVPKQDDETSQTNSAPKSAQNKLTTSKTAFPLSTTQVGDRVIIQQIQSENNIVDRLQMMGLTLGSEVRVLSKMTSGSIIICIRGRQIGLGAEMASQVMVTFAG